MTDLLDDIRAACAGVAGRARFVTIDAARIAPYAASLRLEGFPPPAWGRPRRSCR